MCIIALKPEKVQFSKAQMKIMWDHNPHGAGFMYAEGGKVKIVKGLTTLDQLWDAVQAVGPLRKLVLHFRIKTHGAISPELTHPFWVREGKLALVHNGVIRNLVHKTTDAKSDTKVFAETLSQSYSNPAIALHNRFHREMMEAYIGHSKMVFMDGDGETYILNEHLGEWSKNVWYSNNKYKLPEPTKTEAKSDQKVYNSWRNETLMDKFLPWDRIQSSAASSSATSLSATSGPVSKAPGHFEPTPPKTGDWAPPAKKLSRREQKAMKRLEQQLSDDLPVVWERKSTEEQEEDEARNSFGDVVGISMKH